MKHNNSTKTSPIQHKSSTDTAQKQHKYSKCDSFEDDLLCSQDRYCLYKQATQHADGQYRCGGNS
jgi:hypothetical protein